ncbi:hypothetical protein [Klebsiella pneumoniae]|uniref:hypothetical protein n=2 Tax=Klebsiella pneumoniae TaxID=573 RepID=UPI001652104D|nr:hypothetical protein [Klebsiella pneumoniae]
MMNPVPWLQMTNMISYQGLVRTFPNIPGENGGFSRHSAFFIYSLSFLPVLMKKAQVFANIVPGDNR